MQLCMAGSRKTMYLFPAETTLGWRIIRMVSMKQGLEQERSGAWRRVLEGITGELIGFQLMAAKPERVDKDLPSLRSSASITSSEMVLNCGRSRTAGLCEDKRMERVAQGRMPEDQIERVQRKVMVFRNLGAAKKDILRVWPI